MMSRTYQTGAVLTCVLVLAVISWSTSASSVSLTSSVEEQGRQAVCPGEEVTFTCMVDDGTLLEWSSDAFSGAPEQFRLFNMGHEVGVPRMYDQFTTNLIRLVPTPGNPGFGGITSTLQFIAAAEHDGIVIQCTDRITLLSVSLAVITITVSAPLNPMVGDFNYQQYSFTVAVEWTYPDSDPTPDEFTVVVSTSGSNSSTQTVPGNETSVALTLLYNVDYTVGITATLCGNTSEATMAGNLSEAGCGVPGAPSNGGILLFESSKEGAVIVYQCSPGYSPTGPMNSTCTTNGWTPNPAVVDCSITGPASSVSLNLGLPSSHSPTLTSLLLPVTAIPTPTSGNTGTENGSCGGSEGLSTTVTVVVASAVSFFVAFAMGMMTGAIVQYYISKWKTKQIPGKPPPPVYEQVSTQKEGIELRENVAYGPVQN